MDNIDIKQILSLENRKTLIIDAVINIGTFNDDYLEISTHFGTVCIEGVNLKIEELRRDIGNILITGTVNGIFFKDTKNSKGILSGLLK